MKRSIMQLGNSMGAVIPKGITEHFCLEPGDCIDFRIEGNHIKAIPIKNKAQHPLYEADE